MANSAVLDSVVDAILSGARQLPIELLRQALPEDFDKPDRACAALFWSRWQRQSGLHAVFVAAIAPLARSLEQLPAAEWIAAADHPLWSLLESLRAIGLGYQPELGRVAEKILADLQPLLALLAANKWSEAAQRAATHWQNEQSRLQRIEQRLIDSERGALRAQRAQQLAARTVNRALAGRRLSSAMMGYILDHWYGELQRCVLQLGEHSDAWQKRCELTARLIESLQDPRDDAEQRQRLYALIPEVDADMRAALGEYAHDAHALEQQLALIEKHHVALLQGRPIADAPCVLIANNDPWAASTTSISRDLLDKVTALELGTWFLLRDHDEERRIKLALKMDDTQQLLFVNRIGVKALQKSFEEFAYLLALGSAIPLSLDARVLLRELLVQLLARAAEQQRARVEAEQREAAEAQRRREAKEKALAEAKALADAQERAAAAVEAERLQRTREQELARRQAIAEEQSGNAEQRQRQTRQSATLLPMGSWVELHDELGNAQRLKLAVKLPSSGKLIFVDREGVRRAEFERDAFAACLLEGSARVLDQGPQFEDTLARVVGSLRRDRGDKE